MLPQLHDSESIGCKLPSALYFSLKRSAIRRMCLASTKGPPGPSPLSSLLVAGGFLRAGSRAGPDCARPTSPFPFSPPPCGRSRLWGEGQDCLELRASSDHCFIVGALRAHETVLPLYPLPYFCLPQPGPCDSTGGANLGASPPAAGSLHRAGCEDGRAGQRQDPFISFPPSPPLAGVLF